MRGTKSTYIVTLMALLAAACSSPKPGTPEFVAKQETEKQKVAVKNIESSISDTPDWFTTPPQDANSIYSIGVGEHPRQQGAMDIAVGRARRDLALKLAGLVSTKINQMSETNSALNDVDYVEAIKDVTNNVAYDVQVAGYVVDKQKFIAANDKYKVFVLVRYPIGESNKIALQQINKNKVLDSKLRATKAYEDLEREIENYRKK